MLSYNCSVIQLSVFSTSPGPQAICATPYLDHTFGRVHLPVYHTVFFRSAPTCCPHISWAAPIEIISVTALSLVRTQTYSTGDSCF